MSHIDEMVVEHIKELQHPPLLTTSPSSIKNEAKERNKKREENNRARQYQEAGVDGVAESFPGV